jgi:hypothetical protein
MDYVRLARNSAADQPNNLKITPSYLTILAKQCELKNKGAAILI